MAPGKNIENIHKVSGLEHKHDQTGFIAATKPGSRRHCNPDLKYLLSDNIQKT